MVAYHKEVKEAVAHKVIPSRVHIPTNDIGEITQLKRVWQQAVQDFVYQHLDLTIQHMKYHTRKQWEAIYSELDCKFYYDWPLKPKSMERYLTEQFKSMRSTGSHIG
jgi:UDP-galactopyranose mutase